MQSPTPIADFYIRRPTLHDLNDCARLNASYVTQRVWQMNLRVEEADIQVNFHLVQLPRMVTVQVALAEENLLKCWQRGDCLLVAKQQHQIVGFLHMIPDMQTKTGWIHRQVVGREWRRRGIGTALLKQAVQWGRDHKLRSLTLTLGTKNHPASIFYLEHGFIFNGFNESFFGDQQIHLQFSRPVR